MILQILSRASLYSKRYWLIILVIFLVVKSSFPQPESFGLNKVDSIHHLETSIVNKESPDEWKEILLTASSYYETLKETRIRLVYRKRPNPAVASRPAIRSFFRSRKNRLYRIIVTEKSELVNHRTFNQLVGLIGHELGHIDDYTHKKYINCSG